ncbi:MAG TPA: alpha/beta hydrolase-fold protein [Bryobacteraceae bacterium]|nr:alpha/beta hydrolase-fold protein [Bryobacteraceae bacterium]
MKSSKTGRPYQVSVALPDGYSTKHAPYPVLYAADANAEFGTLVESARTFAEIPKLVIVGIGYETRTQGFAWTPRAVDLTVGADASKPGTMGGAAAFFEFIRNDLAPSIETTYNVSKDRAWFGHSYGGLFGLYAMFHNDGFFRRFIIGSPSIWQARTDLLDAEKAFAASGKPLAARAFFSVGLLEQNGNNRQGMVSDLQDLIRVLDRRRYKGFTYEVHYFEDETHLSVIPATISRGLRFIYGPPKE